MVFSMSRAGWLIFVGAMVLRTVLPALRGTKWVLVVVVMLMVAGIFAVADGPKILEEAGGMVLNARAGSTEGRELIYAASWAEFLRSPVLGHGWIGPSVIREEYLPIGSHSSVVGTLYLGGIVTFVSLILAVLLTLARTLVRMRSKGPAAVLAAVIFIAFVATGGSEGLYALVPSLALVFLFIGGGTGQEFAQPAIIRPVR